MVNDLISADDADWESFQTSDPDWFLRAAGQQIRAYCGWHLSPNIQETARNLRCGAHGIIMLPSRFVTEVYQLILHSAGEPVVLAAADYTWHEPGWIQRTGWPNVNGWYYSGYYYGNDPYYLPANQPGVVSCTFSHGYPTLPEDIKAVAFELAQASVEMAAGNVKSVSTPGYQLELSQPLGMTLNPDQKGRLAQYRIGAVL